MMQGRRPGRRRRRAGVELHQLRYFLAVARFRHFTRAAESLYVAQPSLSQQIQKLEAELGVPLFDRQGRRIVLTAAGERLLPFAERILADVEAAQRSLREARDLVHGRLVVGAPPTVGTRLLPQVAAAFRREYPGIELLMREDGVRALIQLLEQEAVDLAVVTLPIPAGRLEAVPLLTEELVLAVARHHPLARRESVALAELASEPFVLAKVGYGLRDVTLTACHAAGFTPRVALDGGETDTVLRFAAAGLGVAIVPEMAIEPDDPRAPAVVRLREPRLTRTLALAWRHDRSLTAAGHAFVAAFQRAVASSREPVSTEA